MKNLRQRQFIVFWTNEIIKCINDSHHAFIATECISSPRMKLKHFCKHWQRSASVPITITISTIEYGVGMNQTMINNQIYYHRLPNE